MSDFAKSTLTPKEITMLKTLALAAALLSGAAHATDYPMPQLNTLQSFSVLGAFSDTVDFTAYSYGNYTISVTPQNQAVACGGRYCRSPGRIGTTIISDQLRDAQGTAIADVVGSASVYLTPGTYTLHIVGTGSGTLRYAGVGNYSVFVQPPPAQHLCDWYDEQGIAPEPGCLQP